MSVQNTIKRRRLELGLTLKDVAKALGVAEATVSRYETGEIQNMGIDKIEALSRVLRCSPGYLMGWTDSVTDEPTTIGFALTQDEIDLIIEFRNSDDIKKDMVLRLLRYHEAFSNIKDNKKK